MSRIRTQLLAFIAVMSVVLPAAADLTGITTTPINLPGKVYAATVGPDENLWILTDKGNLGKVTPAGTYAEYPLQFGQSVFSLTAAIDGNFWIAGNNGHVERVTTSGVVTDFAVAPNFYFPDPVVSGSDGAIWFYANQNPAPGGSNTWKLGRIDIYGQFKTYDLGISDLTPNGDFLRSLVSGGDGNLWFIDETKNQVVKFSMVTKSIAGTFAIPSPGVSGNQMTLGWDGNVWFTHGTSIDRVTPDGTITEFHVPSGGKPAAILMSGDGNIWFTEPSSGKVGQLVMSSITAGGTATINETALTPDVEEIFLNLPPTFAGLTAAGNALRIAPDAECQAIVRVWGDSFGRMFISVTPPPPECAPVSLSEVHPHGAGSTLVSQLDIAAVFLTSPATGPLNGGNVPSLDAHPLATPATLTAVLNLAAAPGVMITNVSTSDPSATVSFSALKATITSSTSVTANVSISSPSGTQPIAGAVVLSSNLPDPDPKQHVMSFYLDASSAGSRVVLPSNPPSLVITPVARGK